MKKSSFITVFAVAFALFGLSVLCLFMPKSDYSEAERRKLKSFPELSVQTLSDGSFMNEFEKYALDNFPFRDGFRNVKSLLNKYVMNKSDNNGIYIYDEYICKQEYPLKTESLQRATDIFKDIYEKFVQGSGGTAYISVIPDKNYFLADKSGNLSMDYEELFNTVKENTDFLEYIDIVPLLDISDYYETDTHWKQEKITDVAEKIGDSMGVQINYDYTEKLFSKPFYGVYYGQFGLNHNPDEIKYLTNDAIKNCVVTDFENNKQIDVYDMEKANSKDPYEMFLSGPLSLVSIENHGVASKKELVIFRDSFASSLAPLLISGYSKITLVDIRYISSSSVCKMIDFENSDVLFLYSTLVLNNSETLKK